LAALLFVDLFLAHHWLNPPCGKEYFKPSETVQRLINIQKQSNYPVRIMNFPRPYSGSPGGKEFNPLAKFQELWGDLEGFSPIYFGLNTYRAYGTFRPADIMTFGKIILDTPGEQKSRLFAKAGMEYFFWPGKVFGPIASPLPRASIFYQARFMEDREQCIKTWAAPAFPAKEILLIEGPGREVAPTQNPTVSEPAQIIKYENDEVAIEADARQDGWLLLLDSYYPGWKARIDGKPVEIFRADGFFRAVRFPVGKHRVVFSYKPDIYSRALYVAGISFVLWSGLLVVFFRRK
jgi:hypothetical protein